MVTPGPRLLKIPLTTRANLLALTGRSQLAGLLMGLLVASGDLLSHVVKRRR
jgi:hypothetical protein